MEISSKSFDQLTPRELHDLLQLRSQVFVVEQDCVYQDIDGKDLKALHIIGKVNSRIVAYARCFGPGIYFKEAAIGRIVVEKQSRKFGYGHDIMKAAVNTLNHLYPNERIKLSAQTYLVNFYKAHGFKIIGEEYFEDGIPHIAMIK